ncbi:hypothetical protein ACP70R_006435 [Stipagrostis hirtigluma subsp. patula]
MEAEAEAEAVGDADLDDPNPDVQELFRHYDGLYFRGALAAAGFVVHWGSPLQSRSFGSCTFSKPCNTITLSEPVLRYRSTADRKKALLHEMIHAIIYIKHQRKDRTQHGPIFRAWMDAINSCSVEDDQRPKNGYNITTRHDFDPEEPHNIKGILWKCKSCGDTFVRATNQGPPSDACCIENVDDDETCGNLLCRWHNHMEGCGGTYTKMVCTDQKEDPRGTQLLLTYTSETSKSQGAVQESDAAGLQENATVPEPNSEGKILSLVNTSNANSPGSNSKRTGKRHRLEDIEKASFPVASSPRKVKLIQRLAKSEADELISPVDHTDTRLPGRSTSKMAGKQRRLEDVQKPSVLPAASQGKLKLKQDTVVSDKNERLSLLCCNNAKSPRSSSSKKEAEQRHPECVQTAFPLRKSKQDLIAPEKNVCLFPFGRNDTEAKRSSTPKMAGQQCKPKDVQKPNVSPAANQGKLKPKHEMVASEKSELLPLLYRSKAKSPRDSSSEKAAKHHNPESEQQNYSLRKRKQDLVAPEKNECLSTDGFFNAKVQDGSSSKKARKRHEPEGVVVPEKQRSNCKRKPAKEKEYAVMSAWLNYYESEGSSGSDVPLVNKRTERRKKARLQITRARSQITTPYSRSRKHINSVPLVSSGANALVSCHGTRTEPRADALSQQSQRLPPCSDIIAVATDDPVATQATGDQSQPSASCLDIVIAGPADQVPLQSDLLGLTPNQSIGIDLIHISDDE